MADAYERLHELGYSHSVEAWQHGELVGGLYAANTVGATVLPAGWETTTPSRKVNSGSAFATTTGYVPGKACGEAVPSPSARGRRRTGSCSRPTRSCAA